MGAIKQAVSVLQQTDRRNVMDNEERAESARCSGMLHACANWKVLRTGKMRIITYGEGSLCTDHEVLGKACYQEDKEIVKDRLFDIPRAHGHRALDDHSVKLVRTRALAMHAMSHLQQSDPHPCARGQ